MVGYGAGAYQMTMLDRAGLFEYTDCGEIDLGNYPDAGMGGPGGGPGSGEDRGGLACVCSAGGERSMPLGELAMGVVVVIVLRRRRRS
jgi:MYXO-CTERM domain-containing protein